MLIFDYYIQQFPTTLLRWRVLVADQVTRQHQTRASFIKHSLQGTLWYTLTYNLKVVILILRYMHFYKLRN